MTRAWTAGAAVLIDRLGLAGTVLIALAVAGLIGWAWQTFPTWLPRRSWGRAFVTALRGLGRLLRRIRAARLPRRRRRPARTEPTTPAAVGEAADELPELPAAEFASMADAFAAQGRFAEAVRERFRAIVRELAEAGVIAHRPSWTVLELSRAAAVARPQLAPPLDEAGRVFSDLWYGQRTALAEHDERMRAYARDVHAHLTPAVRR